MTNPLIVLMGALALAAAPPADEAHTGLAVGAKAPAFKLLDQDGKERALDELLRKGKVALVFYRSASW